MGAKAEADKMEVVLTDAYADAKLSKRHTIRFGMMEKHLGLESQQCRADRIAIHTSEIHDTLEELAFVGKAMQVK